LLREISGQLNRLSSPATMPLKPQPKSEGKTSRAGASSR
jgi:hypothetical protein